MDNATNNDTMQEAIARSFKERTVFTIIQSSIDFVASVTLLIYLCRRFSSANILISELAVKAAATPSPSCFLTYLVVSLRISSTVD